MSKEKKDRLVAVSGGFDPIHVGHVRMIRGAANYGPVVVILNTDSWLKRKKGYVFMPFDERKEILANIKGVKSVVAADDDDGTVSITLGKVHPTHFANGGDRVVTNTPEMAVCKKYGIEMIWNIGGKKIQSSSELVEAAKENES